MHSGYGGSDDERRDRAGGQSNNFVSSGFHDYTIDTLICSVGQVGCTEKNVFEQLKRYPAPQRFGDSDRLEGVKTGDRSFALGVGTVEHWVGNRTLSNSTIEGQHLLNPGVVLRSVMTVDGQIIIRTNGYGAGAFPQINSGSVAKWIWSSRTDSKIKYALGF